MEAYLSLKLEYGELVEAGEYRGTFKTIGDQEHAEVIRLHLEEDLSMDKTAEKMGPLQGPSMDRYKKNNKTVRQTSSCPACRGIGTGNDMEMAIRASI